MCEELFHYKYLAGIIEENVSHKSYFKSLLQMIEANAVKEHGVLVF